MLSAFLFHDPYCITSFKSNGGAVRTSEFATLPFRKGGYRKSDFVSRSYVFQILLAKDGLVAMTMTDQFYR